jgi:hypothetical protein
MNKEIQPIRSLAARSVANLFAMWYCFWGLVGGVTFLFTNVARLTLPLGLFIPFVDFHLNFSVARAPTVSGQIAQVMYFLLFCSATGWVSGLLTALAYNLISRHMGFHCMGPSKLSRNLSINLSPSSE